MGRSNTKLSVIDGSGHGHPLYTSCPAWMLDVAKRAYRDSGGTSPVDNAFTYARALGINVVYDRKQGLLHEGKPVGLRRRSLNDREIIALRVVTHVLIERHGVVVDDIRRAVGDGDGTLNLSNLTRLRVMTLIVIYHCERARRKQLRVVANDNAHSNSDTHHAA